MGSDCRKCDKSLTELGRRRVLLKESINECISMRDFYIHRNKVNENELKRLVCIKDNLTYLKDVLLQDFYRSNANYGKSRKLLSKTLEEFQEKNCLVKLHIESLPGVSQLRELVQSNEQLVTEHLKLSKMLKNLKQEYTQLFHDLENDLKMKIVEFSNCILELNKKKSRDDGLMFNSFI